MESCINCLKKNKNELIDLGGYFICKTCKKLIVDFEKSNIRKLDNFKEPNHIIDNVYLGCEKSAINLDYLKEKKIKKILIIAEYCHKLFEEEIEYLEIKIDDDPNENIFCHFEKCFEFIKNNDDFLLIHCVSGISRSGSLVIGYVMKFFKMNFLEAWEFVKQKRSCVYPNSGFKKQLIEFEKKLKD